MDWYRLALRLQIPVQELKQKTSSTEFLKWMWVLNEEPNWFHREDSFLAMIALECRRNWVAKPKNETLEQFLIKFSKRKSDESKPEEGSKQSKAVWLAAMGFDKDGKFKGKLRTRRPPQKKKA